MREPARRHAPRKSPTCLAMAAKIGRSERPRRSHWARSGGLHRRPRSARPDRCLLRRMPYARSSVDFGGASV